MHSGRAIVAGHAHRTGAAMHSIELKDISGEKRDLVVSLAAREATGLASHLPVTPAALQPQYHQVGSLAEASTLCRTFILRHKLGGEAWAGGEIVEDGEIVGRVAHSGRVWAAIPATVRRVAARFSELLIEHVGAESMREIARRNAAETAACVCHAHDFTDANMLMLEAIVRVVGHHAGDDSPAMMWLFDVAWQHARMTWVAPRMDRGDLTWDLRVREFPDSAMPANAA